MANQPELTLAIDACPALANPAVARCFQAWKQAWEATRPGKESDYFAEKAGAKAYRSALPALSGVANIGAFIACIAFGILIEVIPAPEGRHKRSVSKYSLMEGQ